MLQTSSFIWKCTQKISITRANMCKLVEFLYYNDKLLFQTSRLYLYIPLVSLLISWKCTIHDKYMSWWVFVIKYCTTVIKLTNMYFINLYRYFVMNTHRYNPWYCVVGSRLLHSSLNFYNVQHLANIEFQTDNIFSIKLTMFILYFPSGVRT